MNIKDKAIRIGILCAIPVLLFTAFSLLAPGFGFHSLGIVMSQTMIPLVIGFGMIFAMSAGLFDLTAGASMIMSAMIGAQLSQRFGIAGLVAGCIGGGLFIGTFAGVMYRLLKIPAMVVSMGLVLVIEILAYYTSGHSGFLTVPDSVSAIGSYPNNFLITAAAAVLFWFIYYRTKFSFQLRVVGSDELVARNMGLKTDRIKMLSYTVGGFFFGIVAILQICYSGSISAQVGMATMANVFQPMMGVMIGMTLMSVLDNVVVNILIGQVAISLIFNGFIAMGMPSTLKDVFVGLFLLGVIGFSNNKARLDEWARRRKAMQTERTM